MDSINQNIDLQMYEDNLPLLKAGLLAKDRLAADDGALTRQEKIELRRQATEGDKAFERMSKRIAWLVRSIVRQEMAKPRTFHVILNEEDLTQAAYEGVFKMCRNLDMGKMSSAVNYLMNWIRTSVEREAAKDEAEFGLSVSKLRLFKKISAVRAKMETDLGRKVSDEEVLEYFHSGQADVKSKYGHKASAKKEWGGVAENQKITLDQIREQRELQEAFPMHYAVTETYVIDKCIQNEDILEDQVEPSNKRFWQAFMEERSIMESQWDYIALALQLYDTDRQGAYGKGEKSRAEKIGAEFQVFLQTEHAAIAVFTKRWMAENGDGPWTVLMSIPVISDDDLFKDEEPVDRWQDHYRYLRFKKHSRKSRKTASHGA